MFRAIRVVLSMAIVSGTTIAAAADVDGSWAMPSKDYSATRYSSLAQINTNNAKGLHPLWSFSTGVLAGHEGQPLVVNNTMYVVTPWPNTLYAFDLTQPDYPLKWKYRPDVSPNALGLACCDSVNRGAFFADGKIIYNLLDGNTVAVDAATGKQLWKTQSADLRSGETITMAPLVAKGVVIVGASGGEFGIHGWLKGLDVQSGRILWTAYNEGPDSEVLARSGSFHSFYDKGEDLAAHSWPNEKAWQTGGGPVWGYLAYDPELDLVYYGTGNPGPYNPEQREGDNKWTCSVLARRPEDGTLVWAYQFTPHDNWDYDSNGAVVLTDLTIEGHTRKALVHFDKNGFQYTLDRATGELLGAHAYVPVNWAKGVDLKSGRPIVDPTKLTGATKGTIKNICPSLEGGVGPAAPPAYSPRTKFFYTSTNNFCMDWTARDVHYLKGTPYMGADSPYHAGPGGNLGGFIAWDATNGRKVWEIKEPYPGWSGALVTGGDVAFYGTLDGYFKAVDAKTGTVLSKFKVGSGVVASPITFRGADGKQYVAVYAGIGGDPSLFAGEVKSDDPADMRDPADFLKTLWRHTSQGGMVWIFGL